MPRITKQYENLESFWALMPEETQSGLMVSCLGFIVLETSNAKVVFEEFP